MTDQATLTPEDAALAAEYAMGLLEGAERAAFEARMRANPVLFGEVQDWSEYLTRLTDDISARPPKRVKRRLMRRLFGARPQVVRIWQGVSALGMALSAGLAILLFLQPPQDPQPQPQPQPRDLFAAELAAEDNSLRLLAVYDGETLRLSRSVGQAAEGRSLELWILIGDAPPRSLGVLDAAAISTIALPQALPADAGTLTLAVSDEPLGGSPTGQPTGAILAVGGLTAL